MLMGFQLAPHCLNTLSHDSSLKAVFVDEQPADRQNLVYYSDYLDEGLLSVKDAEIKAADEAYIQVYFNEFPTALVNEPWRRREPNSRCNFKADKIEMVKSLEDVVRSMADFVSEIGREKKMLGTILLCGHGNSQEFAIPIGPSRKRLSIAMLEVGLHCAKSIFKEPPREWIWGSDLWDKVREDLRALDVQAEILKRNMEGRTDERTLIRIWCCDLGQEPQRGLRDPLEILGKILLGGYKGSIEAPRYLSQPDYHLVPTTNVNNPRVLKQIFSKGKWHPDILAEVESDYQLACFQGEKLQDAGAKFVALTLRPPPAPKREQQHWFPIWKLKDSQNKFVDQNNWDRFNSLWRRIVF
jgi:hypothetical protein